MNYDQSPLEILLHIQKHADSETKQLAGVALKQLEAAQKELNTALDLLNSKDPAFKHAAMAYNLLLGLWEV